MGELLSVDSCQYREEMGEPNDASLCSGSGKLMCTLQHHLMFRIPHSLPVLIN